METKFKVGDIVKNISGDYWACTSEEFGEFCTHKESSDNSNFNTGEIVKIINRDGGRYIIKTENGYTGKDYSQIELVQEGFIVPEKWCVKGSEDKSVQRYFLTYRDNHILDLVTHPSYNNWYFYNIKYKNYYMNREKSEEYTEITFDQFKKYVLKEETMKESRKIIGYKCPTDLFIGKVEKGTIYMPCSSTNITIYYATKNGAIIDSGATNLPKEIVETWEPVYEKVITHQHFTLKDGYILTINKSGLITCNNGEFCINELGRLLAREETLNKYSILHKDGSWSINPLNVTYRIGCEDANRQITSEEIKEIIQIHKNLNKN